MAMKSLMYYVVLIAEASPDLVDILNIFWRGICVESSAPGEFCRPPNPLTLTQATLVVPVLILFLLYVPNMLYVLALNFCKAKGMRMIESSSSSRSSPTCTSTSLQTGSKREDCRKECEGGPSRVPTYRHQPQATEEKGRLFSLCASKLNARE